MNRMIIILGCALLLPILAQSNNHPQQRSAPVRVIRGPQGAPVPRVRIRVKDNGMVSPRTDANGLTSVVIPGARKPGTPLAVEIVESGSWVRVDADDTIVIPDFEPGRPENVAKISVEQRGDVEMLRNPAVLKASLKRIIRDIQPSRVPDLLSPRQRDAVIAAEGARLGLKGPRFRRALELGARQINTAEEKLYGAVFGNRYMDAIRLLPRAKAEKQEELLEITLTGGLAFYMLGRFLDAAREYQAVVDARPDDRETMMALGLTRLQLGQYDEARLLLTEASSGIESHKDKKVAFRALLALSWVFRLTDDFVRAMEACDRAAALAKEARYKQNSREMADLMNAYGNIKLTQRKYPEAFTDFKRSLRIYQRLPRAGLEYITALMNLAAGHVDSGEFAAAQAGLGEAEKQLQALVRERKLQNDHPVFHRLYNYQAGIFRECLRFEEAEEKFRAAMLILEKNDLREHPYYANLLKNITLTYLRRNRTAEALAALQEAKGIATAALGNEHSTGAAIDVSFGLLYTKLRDFPAARTSLDHGYRIFHGKPQFERQLADVHANFAYFNREVGKPDQALEDLKASLELRARHKISGPADYTFALINLAENYRERSIFDEAEKLLKNAVAFAESKVRCSPDLKAEALLHLGLTYARQNKLPEALVEWEKAKRVVDIDPDRAVRAQTLNNLGALYRQLGRFDESETLLLRAFRMWPARGYGESKDQMGRTCQHLNILYNDPKRDLKKPLPAEVQACLDKFK